MYEILSRMKMICAYDIWGKNGAKCNLETPLSQTVLAFARFLMLIRDFSLLYVQKYRDFYLIFVLFLSTFYGSTCTFIFLFSLESFLERKSR